MTTLEPMLPLAPTAPAEPPAGLSPPGAHRVDGSCCSSPPSCWRPRASGRPSSRCPYVALRPGSVRPVTEQVLVEGAPSYPPEESIAYTTVNIGGTTLLEAFVGWLDDDVDVLPEDAVRGDRSAEENRRYNAQLMDTSKLIAITVALEHLGYEVDMRTTGMVVRTIADGSPAAEVLEVDDVIVAVDGEPVDNPGEIGGLLQPGGPGTTHALTVERPAGSGTRDRGRGHDRGGRRRS